MDLQFDKVEAPAGLVCASCKEPIASEYYAVGTQALCPPCREKILQAIQPPAGAGPFLRALGLGLGAAIAGAVAWVVITRVTGFEIGLIAVGIGYGVGYAVRYGAGGGGGAKYQALAIVLAYAAMVSNYAPAVWEASRDQALPVAIAITLAAPFLVGIKNIIGILIIGFALYEAWKMNRRAVLDISGPFQVKRESLP